MHYTLVTAVLLVGAIAAPVVDDIAYVDAGYLETAETLPEIFIHPFVTDVGDVAYPYTLPSTTAECTFEGISDGKNAVQCPETTVEAAQAPEPTGETLMDEDYVPPPTGVQPGKPSINTSTGQSTAITAGPDYVPRINQFTTVVEPTTGQPDRSTLETAYRLEARATPPPSLTAARQATQSPALIVRP